MADIVAPPGLSAAEAALRLARDGPNAVTRVRRVPITRRGINQIREPLVVVLLVAAALSVLTGDVTDMVVILLVVAVNTTVGVVQEVRADRAVEALTALATPLSRVVRDGRPVEVPTDAVVVGDVVVLGEGDVVPADGHLVAAAALQVDESALTGESMPVDKSADSDRADGMADPATRLLSAGTVVTHGRGDLVVTATGDASALGRIAALLDTRPRPTPLQRRLSELSRVIAAVAVAFAAVVFLLGVARGEGLELMALTAVSLVVAAVPESLPAVVTLSLALAARRMARRQAIARRLSAVETLGSVTLLATDKTGTLTEGSMLAERLWTPGMGTDRAISDAPLDATSGVVDLIRAVVLCNDAAVGAGDPTEVALLGAATTLGLDWSALRARWPRIAELPFDSSRKRMTTVHRTPDGAVVAVTKGAPESLLRDGVVVGAEDLIAGARARAEALAHRGYRVLAVASRTLPAAPATSADMVGAESRSVLLGLVGVLDPPRAAAAATIAGCRAAGIVPVLVTGDHPATAAAVAARVGIAGAGDVAVDLGGVAASDTVAMAAAADARVLARAAPEHKVRVVEEWQRRGHVVAMTGDGVNDGPALSRADIGVAMGRRGTEVARQAADLVLADDDLGTVVAAVEEGRRVYANIRRFLLYGVSGGLAELLVMLVGPLAGMPLPLLPAQILWINLLTHGLAGTALGAEPADPGAMRSAPRPPQESVLGAGLWQRILVTGAGIAALTLAAAWWLGSGQAAGHSVVLLCLGAAQLGVALAARAPRKAGGRNPSLPLTVAAAALLLVAAVTAPPLQAVLGTAVVPARAYATAGGAAAAAYLLVRAVTGPPRDLRLGARAR